MSRPKRRNPYPLRITMVQAYVPIDPDYHLDAFCLPCAAAVAQQVGPVTPLESRGDAEDLRCARCRHLVGDMLDIELQKI